MAKSFHISTSCIPLPETNQTPDFTPIPCIAWAKHGSRLDDAKKSVKHMLFAGSSKPPSSWDMMTLALLQTTQETARA